MMNVIIPPSESMTFLFLCRMIRSYVCLLRLEDFGHTQKYYYYGLKVMHKDLGVEIGIGEATLCPVLKHESY
jgi:hypothetical protein